MSRRKNLDSIFFHFYFYFFCSWNNTVAIYFHSSNFCLLFSFVNDITSFKFYCFGEMYLNY